MLTYVDEESIIEYYLYLFFYNLFKYISKFSIYNNVFIEIQDLSRVIIFNQRKESFSKGGGRGV
jgi:hypothetical protein